MSCQVYSPTTYSYELDAGWLQKTLALSLCLYRWTFLKSECFLSFEEFKKLSSIFAKSPGRTSGEVFSVETISNTVYISFLSAFVGYKEKNGALRHTFADTCEICRPGFYGNMSDRSDCIKCRAGVICLTGMNYFRSQVKLKTNLIFKMCKVSLFVVCCDVKGSLQPENRIFKLPNCDLVLRFKPILAITVFVASYHHFTLVFRLYVAIHFPVILVILVMCSFM